MLHRDKLGTKFNFRPLFRYSAKPTRCPGSLYHSRWGSVVTKVSGTPSTPGSCRTDLLLACQGSQSGCSPPVKADRFAFRRDSTVGPSRGAQGRDRPQAPQPNVACWGSNRRSTHLTTTCTPPQNKKGGLVQEGTGGPVLFEQQQRCPLSSKPITPQAFLWTHC